MRVSFRDARGVGSDVKTLRFGIREVSYELTLLDGDGPSASRRVRPHGRAAASAS